MTTPLAYYVEGSIVIFVGLMAIATLWGWQSSVLTNGLAGLVTIAGIWIIYKGHEQKQKLKTII